MMTDHRMAEALEQIKRAQSYLVAHLLEHGHTEQTDAAMQELGNAIKILEPPG